MPSADSLQAMPDLAATTQNMAVNIAVLTNDTGPGQLTVVSVTQGNLGPATVNADNTINYVPLALGQDTFGYTITNGSSQASGQVTVYVLATEYDVYVWMVSQADLAYTNAMQAAGDAALGVYLSSLDEADADFAAAGDAARLILDETMAPADAAWEAAESQAWDLCLAAKAEADADYLSVEPSAWASYSDAVSQLQEELTLAEASYQGEFYIRSSSALAGWFTAEQVAWDAYVSNMQALPGAPALDQRAGPRVPMAMEPAVDFGGLAQGLRKEPVLAPATRYHFVQDRPAPAQPLVQDRAFWQDRTRARLIISGLPPSRAQFVSDAIASLDTTFLLTTIPTVEPGAAPPAFLEVTPDQSSATAITNSRVLDQQSITPAQLARINLRVNLINLKQGLVDRIYDMVVDNPPGGNAWTADQRQNIAGAANLLANDLIRMVDLFLKSHPGASPRRWTRIDGLANRFTRPHCADWSSAMYAWSEHAVTNRAQDHPANRYVDFAFGQSRVTVTPEVTLFHPALTVPAWETQHNFLIIKPLGHVVQTSTGAFDADSRILIFDPWRELLPRVYTNHSQAVAVDLWGPPTHLLTLDWLRDRSADYQFYRNAINNRDQRFNDEQLRLGEFVPQ